MTKTLLSLGDSWTGEDYRPYRHNEIKLWDSRLADKLGYKLVNRGQSGAGNDKIVHNAIDYLSQNNPPDLICVVWTEQSRMNFFGKKSIMPFNAYHFEINIDDLFDPEVFYQRLVYEEYDRRVGDEFFRNMWTLQHMANTMNIPIYHVCGVDPWYQWYYRDHKIEDNKERDWFEKKQWKSFLTDWVSSQYFNFFEKNPENLIGWPFLRHLGGYTFSQKLRDANQTISAVDRHPNNEGMETIANAFFKKIKV